MSSDIEMNCESLLSFFEVFNLIEHNYTELVVDAYSLEDSILRLVPLLILMVALIVSVYIETEYYPHSFFSDLLDTQKCESSF